LVHPAILPNKSQLVTLLHPQAKHTIQQHHQREKKYVREGKLEIGSILAFWATKSTGKQEHLQCHCLQGRSLIDDPENDRS
jgi:F0F1-type ATP synthase epsilon subunit